MMSACQQLFQSRRHVPQYLIFGDANIVGLFSVVYVFVCLYFDELKF